MFTETRTLNLQRTPSLRLLSILLQTSSGQLGSNLKAWREAVITGAPPEVFLPILPSDGWRVLPADLQVYPPTWQAGGRLANTLRRTHVGNGLKFCTLMYLDHLQSWLVYGHGLLIFVILALFWLSEMGQIWGFRALPGERREEMAWNCARWCILTTFRTD